MLFCFQPQPRHEAASLRSRHLVSPSPATPPEAPVTGAPPGERLSRDGANPGSAGLKDAVTTDNRKTNIRAADERLVCSGDAATTNPCLQTSANPFLAFLGEGWIRYVGV
jgi:hypothetical protein